MYCIKMQASSKTETLLDPSTSHLTGSFRIKDGAVRAHVLVTTRDCVGKESREEAQVSKSSWFQRLKPRVGMATPEASRSEKERPPPETEVKAWSVQPDGLSQAVGSRAHQSLQAEASSSTLKLQKTNKREDASEAKNVTGQEKLLQDTGRTNKEKDASEAKCATGQEKLLSQDAGKRFASSAATETGFGPWVNIGFGRRSETENTGAVPANVIDIAMNRLELGKEAEGIPNCALDILPKSLLGSTPREATDSVLCKPLSPKQSKLGLPPRPPGHKVLPGRTPFPVGGPARGAFHQLSTSSRQSLAAPVLEIQNRDAGRHGETSFSRAPTSSKVIGGTMSNALWHRKVSTDDPLSPTRTGNGAVSCEQPSRLAVSELGAACMKPVQRARACSDVPTGKLLEKDTQESVSRNVSSSSPVTGLQLKLVDSGAETTKNDSSFQVASLEFSKSKLCQPVLERVSQHEKKNGTDQDASAFTSATSPWELFIEPAGPLKIAREQFVEVYNRARDELKNQRLSQSSARSLVKESDGGRKLTLGLRGAASSVSIDKQTLKHGQQISAPLQLQGKTTKLEERSLVHQSSLKNQDALRTAGSSQGKQPEGFQRAQLVSERPLISGGKGVIRPDGHADLSIQRLPEGSFVNARDLRTLDRNVAPSNFFCDQNGLFSTPGQNMDRTGLVMGPGKSCNQNDGQEVAFALGKRSRVTFDDHLVIPAVEKITASRPRTQSKPHLWLERWNKAPKYSCNGLSAKTEVLPDGKDDSLYLQSSGLKTFREEDRLGGFAHTSSERVKVLNANSSKVVPSAAAMAIVGTAARHFCASQPEGKGSFAFWSGFGMQTYRRVESIQEKEEKMYEKLNKDLHGC